MEFAGTDADKASAHVASALHAHRNTLRTLQAFLHDNHQLTKLVQDLPQKVSHSVMVPFGKAAFFPGRLVHTNEFLVLLGEGYYAECSASGTLNILDRRGKFLGAQIAGINSQIADLDVEARFFTETLAEAAGEYVEIREEYVESSSSASTSNQEGNCVQEPERDGANSNARTKDGGAETTEIESSIDDKEHELLVARLNELEAAEAAANLDEVGENGVRLKALKTIDTDHRARITEHDQVEEFANCQGGSFKERPSLQSPGDILKFEEWRKSTSKEENANQITDVKSETSNLVAPKESEERHRTTTSSHTGALKAFTGTVLERSVPSLLIKPSQDEIKSPNRPASKFKMRQTKDK